MSITFTCDDKQTLVAYLYGEIDHATRQVGRRAPRHVRGVRAEVMALGDARSELGLWVPPEVELDFTIVKKSELPSATVLRPARWWSTVPGVGAGRRRDPRARRRRRDRQRAGEVGSRGFLGHAPAGCSRPRRP